MAILIHTCHQPRRGPQTRVREPLAVGCTASALLGRRAATRTISSGSGTGGPEGCASAGSPGSRPGTCAEIPPERRYDSGRNQSTLVHVYLEVERIDVESVDQLVLVLHPHGGAVEIDEQPLVHVEVEGVGELDAVEDGPVLRADEGAARVARVHVQPRAQLLGNKG